MMQYQGLRSEGSTIVVVGCGLLEIVSFPFDAMLGNGWTNTHVTYTYLSMEFFVLFPFLE